MKKIKVQRIVSKVDGVEGFLETNSHPGMAPRVFREEGGMLSYTYAAIFHADGSRARFYGTQFRPHDMEIVGE